MKTNGTLLMAAMQLVLLFSSTSLLAQTKYNFRNATRISGSNRQVGALYRFPNVRTGTDALVTITAITGGLTLDVLDDNSSGFDEAFQPTITAPAHSKGYVEFSIQFVAAGTIIPQVQTEIPVTPIDVDGKNGNVYEFDEVYRYNASYVDYNMVGAELNMTFPSANWVDGVNKTGIDYPGIDTTAKQVMFSVVNFSTSTLVVRTGADNTSGSSQQRLRSLYFQKFSYPSSVLSLDTSPALRINNNLTAAEDQPLKVYPSAIRSMVTVKINAVRSGTAAFKLIDYAGRTIKQQPLPVLVGTNSIVINDLGNLIPGNYIVLISMNNVQINQKVIKL